MAVDFEKLVRAIAIPLVNNPDVLLVKVLSEDNDQVSIQLMVDNEDFGRVIGKNGKIAQAIRTILYAGATKEGKRVNLQIDAF